MSFLEVSNLTIKFGATTAIDDVSFALEHDGRLGLIGASGSGKSVTSLAIAGLLSETANITGSIRLDGQELVGLRERDYRELRGNKLSMIFQEPMTALDPTMKVGRQIAEVIALHDERTGKRTEVEQALGTVGLQDPARVADSYPHELSGGQRQRALIAMAIINRPGLVICDEPTDRATLFISHDLAVVREICSEVVVMQGGRVVEAGSIDDVITNPRHEYTAALVEAARGTL